MVKDSLNFASQLSMMMVVLWVAAWEQFVRYRCLRHWQWLSLPLVQMTIAHHEMLARYSWWLWCCLSVDVTVKPFFDRSTPLWRLFLNKSFVNFINFQSSIISQWTFLCLNSKSTCHFLQFFVLMNSNTFTNFLTEI